MLLQGQGNPFEWLTSGVDRQPTTWILYTSRVYQRLMWVDSIQAQDFLHYNLKLLNYDPRIYQYADLPTPPWQGRGQLPTVETMGVPQNFRGVVQNDTTIILVWLTVAGAQWYDVETSSDGESWKSLGRSNINQITATVPAGEVHARVRAASDTLQGGWAIWQGDTTLRPPAMPQLELVEPYAAGAAVIDWEPVEGAANYAVALRVGDNSFYAENLKSGPLGITPEVQEGGPYRSFVCAVAAVGAGGTSLEAKIKLEDKAPEAPTDAQITIGADSVTLQSVSPAPAADSTGYVILEGAGPEFTTSQVLEMRQTSSLPYTWGGLTAGTHYFRIAVKDGFFDIARNPLDLQWSGVLPVAIAGGAGA